MKMCFSLRWSRVSTPTNAKLIGLKTIENVLYTLSVLRKTVVCMLTVYIAIKIYFVLTKKITFPIENSLLSRGCHE